MRIALVHDYLNEAGGAERVLRVLSDMYPEAPIYTAFAKRGSALSLFPDREIHESPWSKFLKLGRFYSYFRFLLPLVWKSVNLTSYDCIITSCSGYIARGFRVKKSARVIAYCHTPPKWLYGYETPTRGSSLWWGRVYLFLFGPSVRYFDFISARRVDTWIANSQEVARRIRKFYRQDAAVIYPPIEVTDRKVVAKKNEKKTGEHEYYLTVARIVGAKGLELAAESARTMKRHLVIAGEFAGGGRIRDRIAGIGGPWVTFAGRVSDSELARLYAGAVGYLALARDEDFGMTVVEAMGYGTPVIAYRGGGYAETVADGVTGIFVDEYTSAAVGRAMEKLERRLWDPSSIAAHARLFARPRFERTIRDIVDA